MRIAVLGTGVVGQTIGGKLVELGHEVRMGSRTPDNDAAQAWAGKAGPRASVATFEGAANFGQLVFNCTKGTATLEALHLAQEVNLNGKVLVDVSNPLDFSQRPPTVLIGNADSLGERVQDAFPHARVVKTLNTMWAGVMVDPRMLPDSHVVYLSGNDASAKDEVRQLLRSFGWRDGEMLDLGDITTARGTEAYLALWLRIWGATQSRAFNMKIVALEPS